MDGNELDILQGASISLSDIRLKSILVEIDPGRHEYKNQIFNTKLTFSVQKSHFQYKKS